MHHRNRKGQPNDRAVLAPLHFGRCHIVSALHRSIAVQDHPATAQGGKSSGKFAASKPFDMHGYRRAFPDLWSSFLRAHFRNPVEVAFFFDMADTTTARHWWNGTNAPMAHFVAVAIDRIPGALQFLRAVQ